MNWVKAAIVGVLVFGLNQNLLLFLGDSRHKEKSVSVSVACACDPANCMCPPSSGCHHHDEKLKSDKKTSLREKQITTCRPNPFDQGLLTSFFGFELPTLTRHWDELHPDRSYTSLDRLSHLLFTQYYLTPPEKPPQISFI